MPICIAGMHRSGTSMLTQMLHASGLYLGDESDLVPPDAENREGHWENKRFVRINTALIGTLYGAWDSPPPLPIEWAAKPLRKYRHQARDLLAEFAGREPWGWKDPRTCLTFPFWQDLIGAMPVVIIVRNPLEVSRSLRERNGFSHALGLALWESYNRRLWDATAESRRIVTHYDRYFQDPAGELERLLEFVGLPVDAARIDEVRAVHNADRRHHHYSPEDFAAAKIAPSAVQLYERLCAVAGWDDQGHQPSAAAASDAPAVFADVDGGIDEGGGSARRRQERKRDREERRASKRTVLASAADSAEANAEARVR